MAKKYVLECIRQDKQDPKSAIKPGFIRTMGGPFTTYERAYQVLQLLSKQYDTILMHMLDADIGDDVDVVKDIDQFHSTFGIEYKGKPRHLPPEISEFRSKFLQEEVNEYNTATELVDKFDALIDLVYVALGTSHLHGFDFREGWRRVHAANMKKIRAKTEDMSKRGSIYDVVKPIGWTAPDLSDLVKSDESEPPTDKS